MNDQIAPPPIPETEIIQEKLTVKPELPDDHLQKAGPSKSISAALTSLWIYIVTQFGLSFILSILASLLIYGLAVAGALVVSYEVQELMTTVTMIISATLSGVFAIVYASKKMNIQINKSLFQKVKDKSDYLKGICSSYAIQVPLSLVIMGLSALVHWLFGTSIPQTGNDVGSSFVSQLLYFILAVLIAPVIEEIVFRGLILNGLKKYSPAFAILFSALCFGLLHMNLYQGIPVAGMGIAFGYLYYKTGTLRVPIAMHMFNNLISVLAGIFPYPVSDVFANSGIVFGLIGLYFIFKDWSEIKGTFAGSAPSGPLWSMTSRKASFWLLVILFIICSITLIFLPALF